MEYGPAIKYFVVDPDSRPMVSRLSKRIPKEQFDLIGTLHGVVCLIDHAKILLWNPAIRKHSSVHLPSDFKWYVGEIYYGRWRSNGQLQTCYGFWIDPTSKEFKVLILQRKPALNGVLYSSVRRDWSVIPTEGLEDWSTCKDGPPVMIGCVAHWGGCFDADIGFYHDNHDHYDKVILSFDFVQESFEVIELPDPTQYRKRCEYDDLDLLNSKNYYNIAPCRWQGALSLLCWNTNYPSGCKIYLRKEDSWVEMFYIDYFDDVAHAFWAMEDVGGRKKRGKRIREMEESSGDRIEETQDSVRVLSTVKWEHKKWTGALLLQGTKSGWNYVKRELEEYYTVNMAYDFVESLLFP